MAREGTFIDTGEAGGWAKALRRAPYFMPDTGDGTLFANLPARFKQTLNAGQQCPEAGCDHAAGTVCAFALCPGKRAADSSFHGDLNTQPSAEKHRGR